MKKIILSGLLCGFFSTDALGNRDYTLKAFSFGQCTPELAQNQYREYFESVDGNIVNDGDKWTQSQFFSSLVEKCVRTSQLQTVKSFMAHFLLKHIQDARIAADGLGKDASMNSSRFTALNVANASSAKNTTQLATDLDNQVNLRRPDFQTAYQRMIFFRYGILSSKSILQSAGLLDTSGHKTATYTKDSAKAAIASAKSSMQGLLSAAFNDGLITPVSNNIEVIIGKFGWDDIQRILPDIAQELENTLQRMHQVKKSLDAYQLNQLTAGAPLFVPPQSVPAFDINPFAPVAVD